ncbi:nitroreductase [Micromonospora sp. NPDC005324]|uniref:nitroreductase family protein n=1 Tax=Micromonospora sp. NPDC005324 TaxID=3157033 RepID=UPI0033B341C4
MTRDLVLEAILTRRSATRLTEPAPGREELLELVQAAATAPDHGRLRPWRLIVVEGNDRVLLGEALRCSASDPAQARRAAAKPRRAPLLLSIVFRPEPNHPMVPEWEQLAAVVAMVQTLLLLLHARGWGAIWRTGPVIEQPPVLEYLGLRQDERLLGWLYIGTRPDGPPAHPREPVDIQSRISCPGQPMDR